MKKYMCIFLMLFVYIGSLFAGSEASKPLVVGTASGYAPFVSLNKKGEYEGFDIDVGKELAQKLGRRFVIKDCGSMPSLMLALKQKKIDVILWGISITEERRKNMEMVYYQGQRVDKMPIIFWGKVPENVQSLSDLGKKNICVEAGSYQEEVLASCPDVSFKYFDKIIDVILDLKYGKSFASGIDPGLVKRFQEKYPELKVVYLPLPPKYQSLGNGVCINRSNQELAPQVKKAIKELIEEGKIAQLEKKWGLENV